MLFRSCALFCSRCRCFSIPFYLSSLPRKCSTLCSRGIVPAISWIHSHSSDRKKRWLSYLLPCSLLNRYKKEPRHEVLQYPPCLDSFAVRLYASTIFTGTSPAASSSTLRLSFPPSPVFMVPTFLPSINTSYSVSSFNPTVI